MLKYVGDKIKIASVRNLELKKSICLRKKDNNKLK